MGIRIHNHSTTTKTIPTSKKRLAVYITIIILVSLSFWTFSRYPELLSEAKKAQQGTLLERNLGTITKDELLLTEQSSGEGIQATLNTIGATTLNWLDTNKVGMSFGIILGGAFLVLLTPLISIRRYFSMKGLGGSLIGMAIGTPMGICANCVVPVGVAMKKKGVSLETTLSAMFASPTLNIVGLMIAFTVLPFELVITKIIAALFLIFLVVPVVAKFLASKYSENTSISKEKLWFQEETWFQAIQRGIFSFFLQTAKLAALVVPLMLLAGLLGATIITLFPLENFIDPAKNQFLFIAAAAIIGTALPIPMLVDLILVLALLQAGLSLGIAATLLITLPSYSIFSTFIIGKYFSRKLAIILFLAVMGTGAAAGLMVTAKETIENARNLRAKQAFLNVVEDSGIDTGKWLNPQTRIGASFADYNGDGYLDLFVGQGDGGAALYRNNGDGTFFDATEETKLGVQYLAHAVTGIFGDYDNDGCPDLYVLKSFDSNDSLFHNNCDGTFKEVTTQAGIKNKYRGRGGAWADYNNDGYLDIYIANFTAPTGRTPFYLQEQEQFKPQPNFLYRNNGDGTFTNVTQQAGVNGIADCPDILKMAADDVRGNMLRKLSFQPVWFDYDNNGTPDLFITNDRGMSVLYHNNGDGTFQDITKQSGLCQFASWMGVTVGDYNNDGYLDLYVTDIGRNTLWHNNGDGTFRDVSQETRTANIGSLGWGAGFLDYDNDGNLDIYGVNGRIHRLQSIQDKHIGIIRLDKLFLNKADGTFEERALQEGIYGNDAKEAAAFGDYNNDGFVDIFVVSSYLETRSQHRLYQNQRNNNHWITIQLVGTKSNRDAVGARITVTTQGISQIREVMSGSSFMSQDSLWQTFGLGSFSLVDTVEIKWPSGTTQQLKNIEANQKIVVTEGE